MQPTLILKEKRDKPIRQRHPWVFSGAVERLHGDAQPGDLVTVADHRGAPLATAYYNPKSQIVARILSWDPVEAIDDAFWHKRLKRAIDGRAALGLIKNEKLGIRNEEEAGGGWRVASAEAQVQQTFLTDPLNTDLLNTEYCPLCPPP